MTLTLWLTAKGYRDLARVDVFGRSRNDGFVLNFIVSYLTVCYQFCLLRFEFLSVGNRLLIVVNLTSVVLRYKLFMKQKSHLLDMSG